MNIATLHTYLADPTQVQRSDIQELKQLLEQYPYVQALRSLYLKALYSNESTSYNQELKKTAAYTLDRDILFSFIVSDDFTVYTPLSIEMQDETEEQIETVAKEKDKDPEQNISTLLQTISKVAYEIVQESPVLTDELEKEIEEETVQSESSTVIESPIKEEEEKAIPTVESLEDRLEIGKPLAFEAEEKYSFQEWLKLSKQQPIVRELDTKKEEIQTEKEEKEEIITEDEKKFQKSLEKKQAMIDKFIETNPKIIPTKKVTASPINIELSVQENTSLMTETLAKIYLEQKKYQKAIQAYEILILKYPEKSSFFANQILDIKALQQHNSL
ncbi:tetratricopeptide repeat protein [Myroides odoratus]|uniref:tetratricopeptide repeat protein n=1 Tax=Myroides odoratus TaxID=256 RepID=UPI00076593CB|nr:tetratricopeptide repeat protein [Myroides odoratus]